jgi:hypothetical protein
MKSEKRDLAVSWAAGDSDPDPVLLGRLAAELGKIAARRAVGARRSTQERSNNVHNEMHEPLERPAVVCHV